MIPRMSVFFLCFFSRLSRGDLGYTVIYIQTLRCIFTMFSEKNSIVSCHWGMESTLLCGKKIINKNKQQKKCVNTRGEG